MQGKWVCKQRDRNYQKKEMLEINILTEMKHAFGGLISRLNLAEGKNS